MTECECRLPEQMSSAGRAAQLCNHSDPQEAEEVRSQLMALLDEFTDQIPPKDILEKPISQLFQEYITRMSQDTMVSLSTTEHHAIIRIAFLRYIGLALHILIADTVVSMEEYRKRSPAGS